MNKEKASYVLRYYGHLTTREEKLANRHLTGTLKATRGQSDATAQAQAGEASRGFQELLSDDSRVLGLAREGHEPFVVRTAERILRDHSDEVRFNYCPQCGALAKTPTAKQCRLCGNDWH